MGGSRGHIPSDTLQAMHRKKKESKTQNNQQSQKADEGSREKSSQGSPNEHAAASKGMRGTISQSYKGEGETQPPRTTINPNPPGERQKSHARRLYEVKGGKTSPGGTRSRNAEQNVEEEMERGARSGARRSLGVLGG